MAEITQIKLLNVPLESDHKNTIYFASKQAQESYFNSKVISSYSYGDFNYIRKDNIIQVPVVYDDIATCNYIMYKNTKFSNKWYYAFVEKVEYENEGTTNLYIKTDVIQTWLFDYTVKASFVEREHTNDDTIGANTVPENLELGTYVNNGIVTDTNLENFVYIVQASEPSNGSSSIADKHTNMGGVEVPGVVYVCESASALANVIALYDSEGKGDAITNVYLVPKKVVNKEDFSVLRFNGQENPVSYEVEITKPQTLDSHSPRNNKLLTFPYCYLIMDNNNGTSNILQFENFSTNNCKFEVKGVPTVGGSIKCTPKMYKNLDLNFQEGIMCGKFPICGWVNDTYINWLTQNAVNIGIGIASSGLSIVGGAGLMMTGGGAMSGASSIVSGAMGIANAVGQVYQHSLMPDSARGNTNGGDINACSNLNKFFFLSMSIKKEFAKIIDDYFDMYGYKTNRVKVPNTNHRANWWYTKTINVNIDGEVPQADMQEIKACYDSGITFWKNPSNIENYNVDNSITV